MCKRKNSQRLIDSKTVLTNLSNTHGIFNRHESTWLRISVKDFSVFYLPNHLVNKTKTVAHLLLNSADQGTMGSAIGA